MPEAWLYMYFYLKNHTLSFKFRLNMIYVVSIKILPQQRVFKIGKVFRLKVNSVMKNSKFNRDYLTFIIDDKAFAVPILSLQGIIGNPNIEPITDSFEFVVGIFYMNNYGIPILDLRTILNKQNTINPNKTCVVIVRVSFKGQEKFVGLIVDSLYSIFHIQVSDIEILPSCEKNEYINGVSNQQNKIILILNLEKIINSENVICFLNQFWDQQCNNIHKERQ